jgi:ribosomal 50S subunit-recycling heat shock protein
VPWGAAPVRFEPWNGVIALRLDLFLKKTCIVRQRSLAKEICDAGAAHVNGHPAKAAHELRPGDVVRLLLGRRDLELRVLELPRGNAAKRDAGRWFEILRDAPRDPLDRVLGDS